MKKTLSKVLALTLSSAIVAGAVFGTGFFTSKEAHGDNGQTVTLTEEQLASYYSVVNQSTVCAHDPSIIKGKDNEGEDCYYIFGSHMAWAKSYDLVEWKTFTNNINKDFKTIFQEDFAWAASGDSSYVPDGNLWAPDIIWNETMQKWCMYMSINGNSWNSTIVLLTADTLEGDWTRVDNVVFSGMNAVGTAYDLTRTDYDEVTGKTVLDSNFVKAEQVLGTGTTASTWNYNYGAHAIDPCVEYDKEGNLYMSYGSWSGGIYMLELDETTGLRDTNVKYTTVKGESDEYMGKMIAGGNFVSGEASYIEKIGDYYYLFVSYGGFSAKGGYNMRIFRSENIDGPYTDNLNQSAIFNKYVDNINGTVGMRLMSYYKWSWWDKAQVAQGHNSAFVDEDGNAYVVYHTRTDDGTEGHYVRVHQLFTNDGGYLLSAPFNYNTTDDTEVNVEDVAGEYEIILQKNTNSEKLETNQGTKIVLLEDGKVKYYGKTATCGTWEAVKGNDDIVDISIAMDGQTYKGVMLNQTMEGTSYETLCFTAVGTTDQIALWGAKTPDDGASVAAAAAEITLPSIAIESISLPTTGMYNTKIEWSSDNTAVLKNDGTVIKPLSDTIVNLTMTISKGNYQYKKTYKITVKASYKEGSDRYLVAEYLKDTSVDLSTGGIYKYPNPFNQSVTPGINISNGVAVRFDVELKDDTIDPLSNLFAITGVGGTFFMTGGSYLGVNMNGDYVDANMRNYGLATDYIGTFNKVTMEIQIKPDGFMVFVDDKLAYSNETLENGKTPGQYTKENYDKIYEEILSWLNTSAEYINFGFGNFWTGVFKGTVGNVKLYAEVPSTNDIVVDKSAKYDFYDEFAQGINAWTSLGAGSSLTLGNSSDTNFGDYLLFAKDSNASSKGAYTKFDINSEKAKDRFTIATDVLLSSGSSESAFVIYGDKSTGYTSDTSAGNYIFKLSNTSGTTWSVNDGAGSVTIPKDEWVTVTVAVNYNDNKLIYTIKSLKTGEVLKSGTVSVNQAGILSGIQLVKGKNGSIGLDNIRVWETPEKVELATPVKKTITSQAWWGDWVSDMDNRTYYYNNATGQNMIGDGKWTIYIDSSEKNSDYNAFSVVLNTLNGASNGTWILASSDGNGGLDAGVPGKVISKPSSATGSVKPGDKFKIVIEREGDNLSVEYINRKTNETTLYYEFEATDLPKGIELFVLAQAGTIEVAYEKELSDNDKYLTGTEWWSGAAWSTVAKLTGDGEWKYTVHCDGLINGYGAFTTRLFGTIDGGTRYLTASSDKNAGWDYNNGAVIEGTAVGGGYGLSVDSTYTVTVKRAGNEVSVVYYDETNKAEIYHVKAVIPNLPNELYVDFAAQVGTYYVAFEPVVETETVCMQSTDIGNNIEGLGEWTYLVEPKNYYDSNLFNLNFVNGTGIDFVVDANGKVTSGEVTVRVENPVENKVTLLKDHIYSYIMKKTANAIIITLRDETTDEDIYSTKIIPSTMRNDYWVDLNTKGSDIITMFGETKERTVLSDLTISEKTGFNTVNKDYKDATATYVITNNSTAETKDVKLSLTFGKNYKIKYGETVGTEVTIPSIPAGESVEVKVIANAGLKPQAASYNDRIELRINGNLVGKQVFKLHVVTEATEGIRNPNPSQGGNNQDSGNKPSESEPETEPPKPEGVYVVDVQTQTETYTETVKDWVAGDSEFLSGTGWWENNQTGKDYVLKGDGTFKFIVKHNKSIDGYGAFNVELYDASGHYLTTGSDVNAWYADGTTGDDIKGVSKNPNSTIKVGSQYTIVVERKGKNITVTYLNQDGSEYAKFLANNTNLGSTLNLHIIAQIGDYEVAQLEYKEVTRKVTKTTVTTLYSDGSKKIEVTITDENGNIISQTTTYVDASGNVSGEESSGGNNEPPAEDENTGVVEEPEDGEIITGTAWWTGSEACADRVMSGNGTWTWTILADNSNPEFSAISVEIYDDNDRYITTGSDENIWTTGIKATTSGASVAPMSDIKAGHTILVIITRNNDEFRITYVDKNDSEIFADFTATITDSSSFPDELKTHVVAQLGTYEIVSFEKGKSEVNLDQMTNNSSGSNESGNGNGSNVDSTANKYDIDRKKRGMSAGKMAIIFAGGTAGVAAVGGGGVAVFTMRKRRLLKLAGKLVD